MTPNLGPPGPQVIDAWACGVAGFVQLGLALAVWVQTACTAMYCSVEKKTLTTTKVTEDDGVRLVKISGSFFFPFL